MSFLRYKQCISEGDIAIVCRGREKQFPVRVERGRQIQVKRGAVNHETLIGKPYGSKVYTSNGKNWVLVLHPTPELWTVALPHRTQILYSTDIAMVTLQLGLRPGSVVVECGTGSGSLSHAVARTIAPNGHLFTFEFHEVRAKVAREEFASHGLSDVVTLACRDVCKDGFGLESKADAVFLDLPSPWDAIETARTAIKVSGGRLCSFSPCLEQVQKTCEKLTQCGFVDTEVLECLRRPYEVRQVAMSVPHMGFRSEQKGEGDHVTPEAGHVTQEAGHVTQEAGRVTQEAGHVTQEAGHVTQEAGRVTQEAGHVTQEAGRVTQEAGRVTQEAGHVTSEAGHVTQEAGHVTQEAGHVTQEAGRVTQEAGRVTSEASHVTVQKGAYKKRKLTHPKLTSVPLHTAHPSKTIPGHTGFLTFATLNPKS